MKVIKAILKLLVILGASSYFSLNAKASTEVLVNKEKMPYEILSIKMVNNNLEIRGWVYISYTQHYLNSSDHKTELEFYSINDSFRITANLTNLSMTNQMQYFGTPKCSAESINQVPEKCNFNYEYIGFMASIPINKFLPDETYQTNIISHAYKSNLIYKTPVYFPMVNDIILNNSDKIYTISSKLNDTEFKVIATTVIARTKPEKTSPVWFYGDSCSTAYKNQLFFLKNTVYKNILEKSINENTSYYRIKAVITLCDGERRRIIEGNIISPVWIASTYIQYTGTPLQISSKFVNRAPYFEANEINLYKGQKLEIFDHVKAIDPEEGDISHRIEVVSSNYKDEIGRYSVNLSVKDIEGLTTNTTVIVNVLAYMNNKPVIYAENLRILQYTNFYHLNYFSAYDQEDGNISNNLVLLEPIDTSIVSIQNACLYVEDSEQLSDSKCIEIDIYSNDVQYDKFRSISKNYLFYKESIPSNWLSIINILNQILQ